MNNLTQPAERQIKETAPVNLSEVKKGDIVTRIMTRYNPQTGVYHIAENFPVARKNKASVKIDAPYQDLFRILDGYQVKQSDDLYGSSSYTLYTLERAETVISRLKENGQRVRRH